MEMVRTFPPSTIAVRLQACSVSGVTGLSAHRGRFPVLLGPLLHVDFPGKSEEEPNGTRAALT